MGAAALGFCLTGLESDKHELRRLARLRPGAWTNAEEYLPGPWLTLDEAGLELWAKDPLRVQQSVAWADLAELEVGYQLATITLSREVDFEQLEKATQYLGQQLGYFDEDDDLEWDDEDDPEVDDSPEAKVVARVLRHATVSVDFVPIDPRRPPTEAEMMPRFSLPDGNNPTPRQRQTLLRAVDLADDMQMDELPGDLHTAAVAELRARLVGGTPAVLAPRLKVDQVAVLAREVERCRAAASPGAAASTISTLGPVSTVSTLGAGGFAAAPGLTDSFKPPKPRGPRRRRPFIQWPICPTRGAVRWLTVGLMAGLTVAGAIYYRSTMRGTAVALFGAAGLAFALFIGASMLLRPTPKSPPWRKFVAVVLAPILFAVGLFAPLVVAKWPGAIGLPESWAAPGPPHYGASGQQMDNWTLEGDVSAIGMAYVTSDFAPKDWLGLVVPPGNEADAAQYRQAIQNTVELLAGEHPDAGQHLIHVDQCGANSPLRYDTPVELFCSGVALADGDDRYSYYLTFNSARTEVEATLSFQSKVMEGEGFFAQDDIDEAAIGALAAVCQQMGPNAYTPLITIYGWAEPDEFVYEVTCDIDDQTLYTLGVNQWLTVYRVHYYGPAK
jgi:hypothetical protein